MQKINLRQIVAYGHLVIIIAMLAVFIACASPARPEYMVPGSDLYAKPCLNSPLCNAIAISKVGGGEKTNPLLVTKVGNKELMDALRLSLRQYGFLNISDVAAQFRLEAFLMELKQPGTALTMIVYSVVRYKLTRSSDDQVVYDDIITASYQATKYDAFFGPQRIKIASEGSIRANIAIFLGHLHSLNIEK